MSWRIHLVLVRITEFLSFIGILAGCAVVVRLLGDAAITPAVMFTSFVGLILIVGWLPQVLLMRICRPRCPDCGQRLQVDNKDPRWLAWSEDSDPVNYHCDCGFECTDV